MMVKQCWCNSVGATVGRNSVGGTAMMEQCWWNGSGGTVKVEQRGGTV